MKFHKKVHNLKMIELENHGLKRLIIKFFQITKILRMIKFKKIKQPIFNKSNNKLKKKS